MNRSRESESVSASNGKLREIWRLRMSVWGLITACGVIATGATGLGFLGQFSWFFDLFSHFRVQLFVTLSLVAGLILIHRELRASAIFGLCAIVNLCTIVPFYFGSAPASAAHPPSLRAMLVNVNTEAGQPDKVAKAIQQFNPDIVLLEEISDRWLSELSPALTPYLHSKAISREDNFGIGLFSKYPLITSAIHYIGDSEVPSVVAEIQSQGGRFTVIGTHPLPPVSAQNSRLRDEQLYLLADVVTKAESPVLLLGDLNATPWSYAFRRLVRESGLRDSSKGHGFQPTWPTFMQLLLIPIDHCLYGSGIHVTSKRVGPNVGSDHYPLIVEFALQ